MESEASDECSLSDYETEESVTDEGHARGTDIILEETNGQERGDSKLEELEGEEKLSQNQA